MKERIKQDIADGFAEDYPICCVMWFAFVWAPIHRLFYNMALNHQLTEAWHLFQTEVAPLVRGTKHVGYIQCPTCRKAKAS